MCVCSSYKSIVLFTIKLCTLECLLFIPLFHPPKGDSHMNFKNKVGYHSYTDATVN